MAESSELERAVRLVADRAAIVDAVVAIANAMDAKDWAKLRSNLDDELDVDYSEFRGEPPRRVTADAYVAARRHGLAELRTLHVSTNHEVRVEDDVASCVSAYRIYRVRVDDDRRRLDTAGTYEHRLRRTADGWRVTSIRQTVVVLDGDRAVHGALRGRSEESAADKRG